MFSGIHFFLFFFVFCFVFVICNLAIPARVAFHKASGYFTPLHVCAIEIFVFVFEENVFGGSIFVFVFCFVFCDL